MQGGWRSATLTGVRDRVLGVLLFLPVPLVLWLFTQAPLGVAPSLLLGLAVTATHRLYARPFAVRRALRRCLWCGASTAAPLRVAVAEPAGDSAWAACCEAHRDAALRTLATAQRWRVALRVGIGGGVGGFLLLAALAAAGSLPSLTSPDAVAFLRLAVALTVVPFSLVAPLAPLPTGGAARVPFPVHIQALIGTWAVLWLFRLIGLLWLAQGIRHLLGRL